MLPAAGHGQMMDMKSVTNFAITSMKGIPLTELFSELICTDGRRMFEQVAVVIESGVDLVNCPLNGAACFKLQISRRLPHTAAILWHVLLPMSSIGKNLSQEPYEWETWIGVFPAQQSLDACAPEMMFTHAVHLISRPEYPKLRLRFRHHDAALKAQHAALRDQREQELRRHKEKTQSVGRERFQELHMLTRTLRGQSGEVPESFPAAVPAAASTSVLEPFAAASEAANGAAFSAAATPPITVGSRAQETELEQQLLETLNMALLGMLADPDCELGRPPVASSSSGSRSTKSRFPALFAACCQVSAVAKERSDLIEQVANLSEANRRYEQSLPQQRQAQQRSFDGETMRQQLNEERRIRMERDLEVERLRAQLADFGRSRAPAAPPPSLLDD